MLEENLCYLIKVIQENRCAHYHYSGNLLRVLKKKSITLNGSIVLFSAFRSKKKKKKKKKKLLSCFKDGKNSAKGDKAQANKHTERALSSSLIRSDYIESVSSLALRLYWRCFFFPFFFKECGSTLPFYFAQTGQRKK
uniref:Uncharacterized protein n=1 Tax=Rhipicephalus zambeziensis TaxID=60191 RepID=A0A224Y757_9ACAR